MIRGLYTSGWSMLANSKMMDVISNNLANVNTNAYKKDTVVFQTFPALLAKRINDTRSMLNPSGDIGNMQLSSDVGQIYTYYTQGQVVKSDNKFDFAIQDGNVDPSSVNKPEAFFTVADTDANGNVVEHYTRNGSFTINSNGEMVTKEGYLVMGEYGSIKLKGEDFTVDGAGNIIQDGKNVDKLMIKEFTDTTTMRKFGDNMVDKTDQSEEQPFSGAIAQGYLEQSNVNIVKEMVDMISVTRSYEANQKIVQALDGTLEKAVNEVGLLR
jgi:flagellar basal-body rod protein FlgF